MSPVAINGVDKQGVYINGVQVKQTLNAANETVSKGVYNATTLSTVDAELATANIKNGITIFGFAGSADVHDISDATAVEAEVLDPETFYAVGGGIRTGTMPTVAIVAANDNYPAGYHAGNVGGLDAIDTDLATANIKYGVTIFGKAGSTDVRDTTDANLTAAEAPTGKTFYAGGGARKTGSGTQTLNPANENVLAGYYAATTLSAVDAQLAVGNIKSGINIFGFVGAATVQDISDANALVGDVKDPKTFYSVTGARKTGTMPTQTLNPANENVLAGYYAATTLSAVDAQLAAANIKSGINIFGFVGPATVQDIADADAVLADVKNGKTFYSVTGGRKTGNLATVALAAGANAYPAGYHVGAASLTAVDGDLVTGSIKFGVTIFGVAGHTNVRDVSDANALVGEVKNGRTFYAVGGARKTGTMPTVALDPALNEYPAGYHAGEASLTAVDAQLVQANIADGVTIFGVLGTLAPGTLAEDTTSAEIATTESAGVAAGYEETWSIGATSEVLLVTTTPTFLAGSLAVGSAFGFFRGGTENLTLKLYMGGVEVAESTTFDDGRQLPKQVVATRALSGAQEVKCVIANAGGATSYYVCSKTTTVRKAAGVSVGSIKLV